MIGEKINLYGDEYIEIDYDDYCETNDKLSILIDRNNKTNYYKKVEKLPIIFEDNSYKIEVGKNIEIFSKCINEESYLFHERRSLPLLIKAVDKWKELNK